MLSDFHAMRDGLAPVEAVDTETGVYSACLFEVVRQVTVHCRERGMLLKDLFE